MPSSRPRVIRPGALLRLLSSVALGVAAAVGFDARVHGGADRPADLPIVCSSCEGWNQPHPAFKVFGNTYYVGTAGLSAILITSPDGLVLLDGDLPQSVPQIAANVAAVGGDVSKVKFILSSHPHFDHAGGIRRLQLLTGATVVSSPRGAEGLELGANTKDDPQFAVPDNAFAPVKTVRRVSDGEVLHLGSLAITAHFTPGHTPGGVTWTWQSCEGSRCLNVVYADSLTAVSADGYRFTGDRTHPSIEPVLRHSIDVVEHLPCDVLLSVHPGAALTFERLAKGGPDAFVDAGACRAYAADARATLDRRVADENKGK